VKTKQHHRSNRKKTRLLHWPLAFSAYLASFGVLVLLSAGGGAAFALNLENHDSFCASCHTEPESRYFQQSQDKSAPTLASFHTQKGVRCIDCHSGGGPLGRLAGLSQGSQDLVAYISGHYHSPAVTTNKLDDGSCTKCHPDVEATAGFDNHFHSFLPRWQAVNAQAGRCVDCHTSHPIADSTQGYLNVPTVQAVCEGCHAVLRRED
jgi:predicted CXXCH cytochrome family protein